MYEGEEILGLTDQTYRIIGNFGVSELALLMVIVYEGFILSFLLSFCQCSSSGCQE